MMRNELSRTQKDLQRALKESMPPDSAILAVYLFGSHVTVQAKRSSDIDLAFLLDDKSYKADAFDAVAPAYLVAAKAGMEIGQETDVTILNASSLEMAYEVVTSGLCLFEADTDRRLEYEATVRGLYFDFSPFLHQLRSQCVANL